MMVKIWSLPNLVECMKPTLGKVF